MKLRKLLMPVMSLTGIATIAAPTIMTSCASVKTLELQNNPLIFKSETKNIFGLTGNFNKGTNYEFVANITKWNVENGKPATEEDWNKLDNISFFIFKDEATEACNLESIDNIKINCDGKELKKGTAEEITEGKAEWMCEVLDSEDMKGNFVAIKLNNGKPISYTSVVKLQNIKFAQDTENAKIVFSNLTWQIR